MDRVKNTIKSLIPSDCTIINYNDFSKSGKIKLIIDSFDGIDLNSTSILAQKIKKLCNYDGLIKWNKNIENGSSYKVLSIQKLKKLYKYIPETGMDVGLKKTIKWYEKKYL